MTHIFDGRAKAQEIEAEVRDRISVLRFLPRLVSIVVGDEEGALMYQKMKQKAAERVGANLEIVSVESKSDIEDLINLIKDLNSDSNVHGVMIQLPIPKYFSPEDKFKIISAISPQKDIDGLRDDSPYIAPVVKAILVALDDAKKCNSEIGNKEQKKVVVVGSEGFVGRKTVQAINGMGYKVEGIDVKTQNLKLKTENANVLVCTANTPNIISKDMICSGAVLIDIGAPVGNLQKDAYEKCAFITPVPGGIGPVTIACLMANLLEAVKVY